MSASSPSPKTLRLQQLTADYAALRLSNRQEIATLSGVVPALRLVVADAQEALRRRIDAERTRGMTRSVLVLDDNDDQRAIMSASLSLMLHVPVYTAATEGEARMLWETHKCSVVVVDLFLGDSHGDRFIAGLPHGVRAILISGVIDEVTLLAAATKCQAVPLSRADIQRLPEMVRDMLDTLYPPLWCRSDGTVLIAVSDDLARLLGYPPASLVGKAWRSLVHPDDLTDSEQAQATRGGKGIRGHVQRMRRADGAYVALSWDVAPLTDGMLYAVARVVE